MNEIITTKKKATSGTTTAIGACGQAQPAPSVSTAVTAHAPRLFEPRTATELTLGRGIVPILDADSQLFESLPFAEIKLPFEIEEAIEYFADGEDAGMAGELEEACQRVAAYATAGALRSGALTLATSLAIGNVIRQMATKFRARESTDKNAQSLAMLFSGIPWVGRKKTELYNDYRLAGIYPGLKTILSSADLALLSKSHLVQLLRVCGKNNALNSDVTVRAVKQVVAGIVRPIAETGRPLPVRAARALVDDHLAASEPSAARSRPSRSHAAVKKALSVHVASVADKPADAGSRRNAGHLAAFFCDSGEFRRPRFLL